MQNQIEKSREQWAWKCENNESKAKSLTDKRGMFPVTELVREPETTTPGPQFSNGLAHIVRRRFRVSQVI